MTSKLRYKRWKVTVLVTTYIECNTEDDEGIKLTAEQMRKDALDEDVGVAGELAEILEIKDVTHDLTQA